MATIALTVNGRAHSLDVDPATPLLYVLSDDLALQRTEVRLRPRPVRRLHGDRSWTRGSIVRDAGRHARRRRDHHARGSRDGRPAASDSAGVHRRAGGAVRLLPQRRDPHRQGLPRRRTRRPATREIQQAMSTACCAAASSARACCGRSRDMPGALRRATPEKRGSR